MGARMKSDMQRIADQGMSVELFDKIDRNHDGTLTRFEFVSFQLMKYGLISEADLDTLMEEFDKLDKDNSGTLTYEDILIGQEQKKCESSQSLVGGPSLPARSAACADGRGEPVL